MLTRLICATVTPPALLTQGSLVRSHRNSGLIAYKLGFQKDVRKAQESAGGEKMKLKVGKKLWDSAGGRPRFWESGKSGKDFLVLTSMFCSSPRRWSPTHCPRLGSERKHTPQLHWAVFSKDRVLKGHLRQRENGYWEAGTLGGHSHPAGLQPR